MSKSLIFNENFVSLDFWSKVQKICAAGITKFSDFGSTNFGWFYGFKWYRKEYWTQFICVEWVNKQKFETYWEFCKFGFWVRNEKNLPWYGQKFPIWGQQISFSFMVPNDTEQTTEDISSVETGYTTKIFRFIEKFVSLDYSIHFISWDWVNNNFF